MPGDGFAFSIRVGCQIDVVAGLGGFFQIGNDFLLALDGLVVRLKIVVEVDADLALGQVTDVTHRSLDGVAVAQVATDGLCFCR